MWSVVFTWCDKGGKKKIIYRKAAVCIMAVMGLSIIPVICRFINISKAYPMHGAGAAITDIPYFEQLPSALSIRAFIILLILAQMGALIVVAAGTLVISYWRKTISSRFSFRYLFLLYRLSLKYQALELQDGFLSFHCIHGQHLLVLRLQQIKQTLRYAKPEYDTKHDGTCHLKGFNTL